MTITEQSLKLFLSYAEDAANWNGQPMLDCTAAQRGNVTQLKRAGLIETVKDDGIVWVIFTEAGRALAREHGITIEGSPS